MMTQGSRILLSVACCYILYKTCLGGCPVEESCGFKATCVNNTCVCPQGYLLHSNNIDCKNRNCSTSDCLECGNDGKCQRCTNFIDSSTLQCLEKCNGEARRVQSLTIQGSVCQSYTDTDDHVDVIIGVAAGVSAGILVCVIIGLSFYCHLKRTRKNINLQSKHYKAENMQRGRLKTIPMYDNKAFQPDPDILRRSVVDKDVYFMELERLRPEAPTLLTILNQIRRRLRSMDSSDTRVSTYKGVIHQLCRVLVLVHKKDPGASIPSDALGLMEWAHQMLEDYRQETQEQSTSGNSTETPVSKISYVDVPGKSPTKHQYAIPNVQQADKAKGAVHSHQSSISAQSDTGYYSSTPVPVEYHSHTLPYAQIRNSVSTFTAKRNKSQNRQSSTITYPSQGYHSSQGSDLSVGYFKNGHYYDPSPNPEVYAPASSYSDRSNQFLSTFLSDHPRTHSVSSGSSMDVDRGATEDGDIDTEDEGEGHDPLPFDPKDATEPVEV